MSKPTAKELTEAYIEIQSIYVDMKRLPMTNEIIRCYDLSPIYVTMTDVMRTLKESIATALIEEIKDND